MRQSVNAINNDSGVWNPSENHMAALESYDDGYDHSEAAELPGFAGESLIASNADSGRAAAQKSRRLSEYSIRPVTDDHSGQEDEGVSSACGCSTAGSGCGCPGDLCVNREGDVPKCGTCGGDSNGSQRPAHLFGSDGRVKEPWVNVKPVFNRVKRKTSVTRKYATPRPPWPARPYDEPEIPDWWQYAWGSPWATLMGQQCCVRVYCGDVLPLMIGWIPLLDPVHAGSGWSIATGRAIDLKCGRMRV